MSGTILLTCGYVGSRLLRVLEEGGCAVRCLARERPRAAPSRMTTAVVAGDCLDEASLAAAMAGVDHAYYLVHSMASGPGLPTLDRRAVAHRPRNVRAAVDGRRPRVQPRWVAALVLAVAATLQPADARAQTPPVRPVPFVDLDRYAGDWFEIARFPNRFQRQCVGDVRASYARRADGRIDVVNRCRTADGETEARGVARLVDEQTHAKLKVRFAPAWLSWLPAVWGDYWIVGLAPDYSWAVVGDPERQYLWILARTPRLEGDAIAAARTAASDNGFDIAHLVPTPQEGARR